jgi:prepilin-type N-terminal cleavage/methylation domain-containing protein
MGRNTCGQFLSIDAELTCNKQGIMKMKNQDKQMYGFDRGFTLVELILVVLILGIAALVAVPMFSSAADIQVRATANRIAADLDYARGLAITRQKHYAVVFDRANEIYDIRDAATDTVITNPLDNRPFTVNLANDSRSGGVNIVSTDFTDDTIEFDYLGTPYAGGSQLNAQGVITLRSRDGSFSLTVTVEPMTGCVSIE